MQKWKYVIGGAAAVVVVAMAYGLYKFDVFGGSAGSARLPTELASVNKKPITLADVEPLMALGMAKPQAIETAINRVIVSEAALREWPDEARAIAESTTRTALSDMYLRKKVVDFQKAVTDSEIVAYYDKNVTSELTTRHVLKYYLTQDAKDANEMVGAIQKGEDAYLSKFVWVNKEGDHSVLPGAVPYGLYQQVKKLQSNHVAGPFRVRDGLLFLRMEQRINGQRPELQAVKEEIRNILAQQHLESALRQLRDAASIQLR